MTAHSNLRARDSLRFPRQRVRTHRLAARKRGEPARTVRHSMLSPPRRPCSARSMPGSQARPRRPRPRPDLFSTAARSAPQSLLRDRRRSAPTPAGQRMSQRRCQTHRAHQQSCRRSSGSPTVASRRRLSQRRHPHQSQFALLLRRRCPLRLRHRVPRLTSRWQPLRRRSNLRQTGRRPLRPRAPRLPNPSSARLKPLRHLPAHR